MFPFYFVQGTLVVFPVYFVQGTLVVFPVYFVQGTLFGTLCGVSCLFCTRNSVLGFLSVSYKDLSVVFPVYFVQGTPY